MNAYDFTTAIVISDHKLAAAITTYNLKRGASGGYPVKNRDGSLSIVFENINETKEALRLFEEESMQINASDYYETILQIEALTTEPFGHEPKMES